MNSLANLDWKMLAIIVAIVIAVTIFNKRTGVTWSGKPITVEGIDVEYKLHINISDRSSDLNDSNKNRPSKILIGMPADNAYDYQLTTEHIGRTLLKSIGANKESEVRIPEFDDTVFIQSKHGHIENRLSVNTDLRQAVLALFASGNEFNAKFSGLFHRHGKLWLEYRPTPTFKEKTFLNNIAPAVKNLQHYLKALG